MPSTGAERAREACPLLLRARRLGARARAPAVGGRARGGALVAPQLHEARAARDGVRGRPRALQHRQLAHAGPQRPANGAAAHRELCQGGLEGRGREPAGGHCRQAE
eukprot:1580774-Prymnesium_polylepis.2